MYPKELFLGMGMYEIMLVLGFLGALICVRVFSDRYGLSAAMQNLCIGCSVAALIGGYGSAVLFQAVYNALDGEGFAITKTTGATFYGGLIGGTAIFILIYFAVGHFVLKKGEAKRNFPILTEIAAPAVAVAHALGRIGCLFAGCCHGRVTDAWYGIRHDYLSRVYGTEIKVVPIQLLEALFLLALFAFFVWRLLSKRKGNLALYLILYAVWRFAVEFWRDDDRGASLIPFLSPSQMIAVLLCLLGGTLLLLGYLKARKGKTDEA